MRVVKKYDERFHEILDAAELLFTQKSFEKTTVQDILEKVKIGKGTFYYYFKSKEEVVNAVIKRVIDKVVHILTEIADNPTLDAQEKMKLIILGLDISGTPECAMIEELHQQSNALMHQKSIVETIQLSAPILAKVIEQGVREGVYHTAYPLEHIEFLMVGVQFIFDEGIFQWKPEEKMKRLKAFVCLLEQTLGAKKGSFDYMLNLLSTETNGGVNET